MKCYIIAPCALNYVMCLYLLPEIKEAYFSDVDCETQTIEEDEYGNEYVKHGFDIDKLKQYGKQIPYKEGKKIAKQLDKIDN